jgi:tRNA threonylcarbamoyladenosine biosynthesis protein TsaB
VKILGIETALGACSVALLDGNKITGHAHEKMKRGHAEALAPMTESVMCKTKNSYSNLERLAVTTGPGTFTGQRVGIAFVRAMALALKIPAVGVTTLDALSEQALQEEKADWALAVSDAKRGEVYLSARALSGETLVATAIMTYEEAATLAKDKIESHGSNLVLAGTGAEILLPIFKSKGWNLQPAKVLQPDAIFVALLGAVMPTPKSSPKPLYLRAPDAKLPRHPVP